MSNRWSQVSIWFAASLLAVLSCSLTLPTATLKGEYLPVGNDSFYHARRILDTAREPAAFYEFDPHIHAPEGSLLPWPWGYDYGMAWLVRIGTKAGLSAEPLAILVWIPVAAVLLSIALLIVIARRLELSTPITALAALCMALSPMTQQLHGVGQIDHHFAELIFILAALAAGLGWLRNPERPTAAAAAAVALGLAPAVQNGLFILQLPLLTSAFLLWLQGKDLPRRTSLVFAGVLLGSTLAILIPSLSFRTGRFEFYTLSWYHLYIAACTAVTIVLMSRMKATRNGIIALAALSATLLIPIVGQLQLARSFIAGTLQYLQAIGEMQPPLRYAKLFGATILSNYYSYLIWIAPLTFVLCLVKGWQDRSSARLLFWITCVMGLALLSTQMRMHYFGGFALYLPWLVVLQDFVRRQPEFGRKSVLLATLTLVLLYFPSLRHQLVAPAPRANDIAFENLRPIFDTLRTACAKNPGVVLTDGDVGHYVRYYTDCSVLTNNFLLTPQDMAKAEEAQRLFTLPARELAAAAPQIKYVLLRPFKIGPDPSGKLRYTFYVLRPELAKDLLIGTDAAVPAQYILLDEIDFPELDNAVYARLYEIQRDRQESLPSAGALSDTP